MTVTRQHYHDAFEAECARSYPVVDAIEQRYGFAVSRDRLEAAARVLACPVKANPPCWQHGRVLYAVARAALAGQVGPVTLLDIGTAKGFSALCLRWALGDAGIDGEVVTVDVIDPLSRVRRNSVAELEGLKTLAEFLAPWPEASTIRAHGMTGLDWLRQGLGRLPVVFVDGKHEGRVVAAEGAQIAARQASGDVVVFDDVHLPDVKLAVSGLQHDYTLEWLPVLPKRAYAIGVRR
jgi:predicted O-methyltransferase YrrM